MLMSAQPSVIAASTTCPCPLARARRMPASSPTAMNIAPPHQCEIRWALDERRRHALGEGSRRWSTPPPP